MLKSKTQFIIFFLLAALVLAPGAASAAGLVPCGGAGEDPCNVRHFFYMVARVTNWLIAMAGVYAVYVLIGTGFWMVTAMGNEEAITKQKKTMTNAVVGFVFVALAFLFVNTAVNLILMSKCKIDLSNPLNYLTIKDYNTCK